MDSKRLILVVIFSFSIMMLWNAWQREHNPPPVPQTQAQEEQTDSSVPQAVTDKPADKPSAPVQESGVSLAKGQRVRVETDTVQAEIDTNGGDLRYLALLKHRDDAGTGNFVLLDDSKPPAIYVAQSGLVGTNLPSHKAIFTASADNYTLQPGQDKLEVKLSWSGEDGVSVDKIYTFHRDSYVVDLRYEIHNGSTAPLDASVYYQIMHDSDSAAASRMMPTFTGGAYYTDADKYKKIKFDKMREENLSQTASDGWLALVQHYFVSAWLPKEGNREYYTKALTDKVFLIGAVSAVEAVAPGASATVDARFYAGPQVQTLLEKVAPGMENVVDYGWLKVIASPLFWLLSQIHKLVQNWGVAIILLTVLIKLAFYPLSAKSYKSMAHMRELAPRLQRLKEQYGDDRQKMHQAMMELYKTEKINPMGGCLPIVVQIPVFISLYWVLLGSVEMRHAPFMLWIHDLSAVDPYYVLPVLMAITMFIQTRLNPKPPDPIQAKMMMFMPIAFSVFFFFFPAGLVLYWLINNVLSIAQQWNINRTIGQAKTGKKSR
ncbi:MAG: membrane protein insertase YidC [Methylobacillus sp.]|jgi:YidC/Oxa1 family membrane protein insertase|nr:membrane protein insertase YidC [Methylobacillus sp.]